MAMAAASMWNAFLRCLSFLILASLLPSSRAAVTVKDCAALNTAIQRINNGENVGEIRIPQGTTISVQPCSTLTPIANNTSIIGLGSPAPVITGGNTQSIFSSNTNNITITLTNLVLKSGTATNGGCLSLNSYFQVAFISNVVFQSCSAQYGGAIYGYSSQLILSSVKFLSNSATLSGGAIYLNTQSLTSSIDNCFFFQNSATSNFNSVYGGAIYSSSSMIISNSNFTSNFVSSVTSGAYGGAVSMSSAPIFISSSIFVKNNATSSNSEAQGGAVRSTDNQPVVYSCIFDSNSVSASKYYGVGGAIYSYYGNVSSTFIRNRINAQMGSGGAIYVYYQLIVSASSFTSNSIVATGRFSRGGAVYIEGASSSFQSSISNSNFVSNSVSASGLTSSSSYGVNGGAVYSRHATIDSKNTFTSNSAVFTATDYQIDVFGGGFGCEGILTTTSSTYSNNQVRSQATNAGGSAISTSSILSVSSSSFTSNSAASGCQLSCDPNLSGGGAIFNNYQVVIKTSTFTRNSHQCSVSNGFSSGGAIFLPSSSYTRSHQISYSTFSNNSVIASSGIASGGAISISSYYGVSQVNNSMFSANTARGASAKGGSIFLSGYPFVSQNSSFIDNSVIASSGNANGGALDLSGSGDSNPVVFATFTRNSAVAQSDGYANGGAIYHGYPSSANYPPLLLSYSAFQNNSARGKTGARGGSIFIADYQSLTCSYSSFKFSLATANNAFGGGVFGGNYSTLSFCSGNTLDNTNSAALTGKSPISSKISTGVSPTVKFCPLISLQIEPNATYTPFISCDTCDCTQYINPCHPLATCKRTSSNPAFTYCLCPANNPGTGFSCGVGNACTT